MFVIRYWHYHKQLRPFEYICEGKVKQLLNWDNVYEATEVAMKAASQLNAVQPIRSVIDIPETENQFLTMPAYINDAKHGTLACKIVSLFPKNTEVPTITANVMLFCQKTGQMKAVVAGNHITSMRTAAASVISTKTVYKPPSGEPLTMAIFGAGSQGTAHAEAFHHFFDLREIRILDADFNKAKEVAAKLNKKYKYKNVFKAFEFGPDCAKDADIIVTATFATCAVVRESWLKKHCHIIILSGNDGDRSEIDDETFRSSEVFTDNLEYYKKGAPILFSRNYNVKGEIGSFIGQDMGDRKDIRTVFVSFGMGVQDAATANLAFQLHKENGKR